MLRLAICLLLLGGALVDGQEASPASFEGRPITRIEFDPQQQPFSQEELSALLTLKTSAPLQAEDVRTSIQALFLTGRYRDLAVEAFADGPGVRLTIQTDFNYFLSGVTVSGESEPPNAAQLVTAAKLQLGTPVTESDVAQAIQNLQDRMKANGFYQSKITYEMQRASLTGEANVKFLVDPGNRARFDGVNLSGNYTVSPETIVKRTDWHRGFLFIPFPGWRQATESRVQTGVQKVLEEFQKSDRLQSKANLLGLEYHVETNRVTPSLVANEGPLTEVRATGARVSRGRLRQLVPVFQERTVDRNLLVEGRRNLLEYFQSQGYFDVQVDFTESQPGPEKSLIEYNVVPGIRHKLESIAIAGNKYFDSATLRERIFILPASFIRNRNGRFSQKLLESDKNTIRDLYRANGFRDVEVTSEVTEGPGSAHKSLAVTINVKEGPQWFVRKLEIAGMDAADQEYLRSVLQSTEGQPYSEVNVAADRDTVLNYFYNNGYADASFDWEQKEAPEVNRVDLLFTVQTGDPQYVRDVLVTGLAVTDRELVRSRILLNAGDSMSQNRIGQSQQRLYDLGIFAKVQTAVQNPEGNEKNKYVIFHMDEARKYSFNMGIGAEIARIGGGSVSLNTPAGSAGFSPRVSLGVSRINFRGLGHTIGVQTLASTIRQRAVSSYLAPQFKGKENLALTFSALFDNARDVRTFSALRIEGSVQLSQRLSRAETLQYRYTFRRVDPSRLNINPVLVPVLSQPNLTGLIGASIIQDKRDDPVTTQRGIYNTLDFSLAARVFGSRTDFTRFQFRNSTYHRIGRDIVLARSGQFGYIQRFGGQPQLPLAERFYAGGSNSHRGFPENQAGPRDLITGFPLGGSALLFHSTELRFPLIGDNLGGVFFHDMGNVFTSIETLSFRVTQKNDADFDYMVHAVGFGIRYRTPVGPIRIDLSVSPNSPHFIGYAGTPEELAAQLPDPVRQRINVFQFHFSLGQTF